MEINRHICFRAKEQPQFVSFLEANRIKYEAGDIISTVDICESAPCWEEVSVYLERYNISSLASTVFSLEELETAQWLRIRSQWRCGYPQPESKFGYQEVTYTSKNYCSACGAGLKQVDAFRLKADPKWGKRHFMMLNWVEDELFVSDEAKEILEHEKVAGISFLKVKNKTGKEFRTNCHQISVHNTLNEGLLPADSAIRDIQICSQCGAHMYQPSGIGIMAYRKEVFDNASDVVKSGELFGWGHYSARYIYISQRIYQIIKNNALDRNLSFEPLLLL